MILAQENVDVAIGQPDRVLWSLTDHLGSVTTVVDSDGQVVDSITYDSFGQIVAETNAAVDFLFGYTGRDIDRESDLYFYRARYYDPGVGRFVSRDPIGFAAGDANLYRYVGNEPTGKTDPSGLDPPLSPMGPGSHLYDLRYADDISWRVYLAPGNSPLANRMQQHYLEGAGCPFKLTLQDLKALNPRPLHPLEPATVQFWGELPIASKMNRKLLEMLNDRSGASVLVAEIEDSRNAFTGLRGTLHIFRIDYRGKLIVTRSPETTYRFEGEMRICDTHDYSWPAYNWPVYVLLFGGREFPVESDWLPLKTKAGTSTRPYEVTPPWEKD